MRPWFRAIALDYDGTLVHGDRAPGDDVLGAVADCRRHGQRAVLVTGRILEELRGVFPAVDEWFDAIVAENGAVLALGRSVRVLAAPVEVELDEALIERAVPFRRGQVLLATQVAHEGVLTEELRRLGLESQLVRNRAELMVLPPGVSKGFGVYQALGELGVSHHSAIGFGDAENDHSLLRTCEVGVAVADAVPSLQRQADVVLDKPGGPAVAEFLRGPVLSGERTVEPRRWQLELGRTAAGARVRVPASQVNVLVVGRSGSGKSFLAGLLAEQLIGLGYSVCIVDPEGDYAPLGSLRGTLNLGGREPLPDPEQVGRFIEHRFGSLLLDLSMIDAAGRERYVPPLLERLEAEREANGLPHWIFLDEAHHLRGPDGGLRSGGHCLVTYRPHELPEEVRERIDVVLALPGGKAPEAGERDPLEALEELWGLDFGTSHRGRDEPVLLARPRRGSAVQGFRLTRRRTRHVRHWHKYFGSELPPALQFVFRDGAGGEARHVGVNMGEFHRILMRCDPAVILYHVERGDLSRWIRQAVQDVALGRTVHRLEEAFLQGDRTSEDLETLRMGVVRAIEERYVDLWSSPADASNGAR